MTPPGALRPAVSRAPHPEQSPGQDESQRPLLSQGPLARSLSYCREMRWTIVRPSRKVLYIMFQTLDLLEHSPFEQLFDLIVVHCLNTLLAVYPH